MSCARLLKFERNGGYACLEKEDPKKRLRAALQRTPPNSRAMPQR